MMDLPTKAEVICSDGPAGRTTYVVFDSVDHRMTNLVVKSYRPPFTEYLVPVSQVTEITPDRITLGCTREELVEMGPFEVEQYIRTMLPDYATRPHASTLGYMGASYIEVETFVPVKVMNIGSGERAVRSGAQVKATDGHVGQVGELLVNADTMEVTHFVLREKQILGHREVTVPISEIERVYEETVYLKLDRQSLDQLPTTPIQRWPHDENEEARLAKGAYFPWTLSSTGYVSNPFSKKGYSMDRMIVVVFDSELKAYEGSKALQDLQREGSINLYAKAVIVRDASGAVTVKQQGDGGPIGMGVGMLTGSLIGLIGGPLGVAIGASAGSFGGLMYDLVHLGVSQDFLTEVEGSLLPGKAALVAEVWEEWTMPVDTRMVALGGVVIRESVRQVLNDQIEKDIAALTADVAQLEAERDQATGEAKAALQAKVDAAKSKLQAAQDGITKRLEASQKEAESKIVSLQEQATKESGERKAKREARIAELKADQKRRGDLLKQALELTKKALS